MPIHVCKDYATAKAKYESDPDTIYLYPRHKGMASTCYDRYIPSTKKYRIEGKFLVVVMEESANSREIREAMDLLETIPEDKVLITPDNHPNQIFRQNNWEEIW